jgi:hypothetical protein
MRNLVRPFESRWGYKIKSLLAWPSAREPPTEERDR